MLARRCHPVDHLRARDLDPSRVLAPTPRAPATRRVPLAAAIAGAAAALVALAATPAHADTWSAGEPEAMEIWGGQDVTTCGWPTAVAVTSGGGLCTGTLVSPWVITYAAHCGGGVKEIVFGESVNAPGKKILADCKTYPNYSGVSDQAHDWAYCILRAPVRDIPVTPVLYGCEPKILSPGKQIAIVGFGANDGNSGAGRKRWAMTTINAVGSMTVGLGGGGNPSVCPGDSGGPAFIDAGDGVWRAFGIASTVTGGCGGAGTHALQHKAAEWIEEDSGYDITPCHDADGTWNPTHNCGGFFSGDHNGSGAWGPWCPETPASASSNTCGAPFDSIADNDAPTVTITAPLDQSIFLDPIPAKLNIEIDADDGDGWGVAEVRLRVNGEEQPLVAYEPPYSFDGANFPKGTWTLQALAEDAAGQIGESPVVTFYVGEPEPVDDPETETETDSGGDSGTDGDDSAGTGDGGSAGSGDGSPGWTQGSSASDTGDTGGVDDDSGCGCRSPGGGDGDRALLLGLALGFGVFSRRRRRHR